MTKDLLPSSVPVKMDSSWGVFDLTGEVIEWTHVYCASCGVQGPKIPTELITSGGSWTYYCEESQNNCAVRYKSQVAVGQIPDEVWFAKLKEFMLEDYGRDLEENELLELASDPNSRLNKLLKDRHKSTI